MHPPSIAPALYPVQGPLQKASSVQPIHMNYHQPHIPFQFGTLYASSAGQPVGTDSLFGNSLMPPNPMGRGTPLAHAHGTVAGLDVETNPASLVSVTQTASASALAPARALVPGEIDEATGFTVAEDMSLFKPPSMLTSAEKDAMMYDQSYATAFFAKRSGSKKNKTSPRNLTLHTVMTIAPGVLAPPSLSKAMVKFARSRFVDWALRHYAENPTEKITHDNFKMEHTLEHSTLVQSLTDEYQPLAHARGAWKAQLVVGHAIKNANSSAPLKAILDKLPITNKTKRQAAVADMDPRADSSGSTASAKIADHKNSGAAPDRLSSSENQEAEQPSLIETHSAPENSDCDGDQVDLAALIKANSDKGDESADSSSIKESVRSNEDDLMSQPSPRDDADTAAAAREEDIMQQSKAINDEQHGTILVANELDSANDETSAGNKVATDIRDKGVGRLEAAILQSASSSKISMCHCALPGGPGPWVTPSPSPDPRATHGAQWAEIQKLTGSPVKEKGHKTSKSVTRTLARVSSRRPNTALAQIQEQSKADAGDSELTGPAVSAQGSTQSKDQAFQAADRTKSINDAARQVGADGPSAIDEEAGNIKEAGNVKMSPKDRVVTMAEINRHTAQQSLTTVFDSRL
ncbi:hypothetical protein V8E36_000550 [Tilletia maclaganii]